MQAAKTLFERFHTSQLRHLVSIPLFPTNILFTFSGEE